jgi:hypothetical protein
MNHKKDLLATAVGLPMLAALFIASGDPMPECSASTYWTVEVICIAVIIAGAFILRRIYKTENQ